MKKLIRVCIFAVGFGVASFNTNAYDGVVTKSDDLLVNSNAIVFADYMTKNAKGFILANESEWEIFNKVVTNYNQSASKFLATSAEDKENFFLAAEKIQENLASQNSSEMNQWKNSVAKTTNVFKFIWGHNSQAPEIEVPSIPVPQWWGVLVK